MSFVVPPTLVETVGAEPSLVRFRWLAGLRDTVAELADVWGSVVAEPFRPGGPNRGGAEGAAAADQVDVQGDRYPAHMQKWINR